MVRKVVVPALISASIVESRSSNLKYDLVYDVTFSKMDDIVIEYLSLSPSMYISMFEQSNAKLQIRICQRM
jgi:hypothetical protein